MTPDDIETLEASHKVVDELCDGILIVTLRAIEMSRELGKALEHWKTTLPPETELEQAAEAILSPDLCGSLEGYLQIAAMPFADNIKDSKVSLIQNAMKILQLIPKIVTNKEAPNATEIKKTS